MVLGVRRLKVNLTCNVSGRGHGDVVQGKEGHERMLKGGREEKRGS